MPLHTQSTYMYGSLKEQKKMCHVITLDGVREGGLSFRTLELRDGDLDELTEGMLDEEDELTEEGVDEADALTVELSSGAALTDEELEEWLIPYRFSSTVSKP